MAKSSNVETSLYSNVSTFSKNGQIQEMWNTNDDTILESGQNQEMFPHFQKIDKIKKCRYVSIYRDVSKI